MPRVWLPQPYGATRPGQPNLGFVTNYCQRMSENLTDQDRADLARFLRAVIEADPACRPLSRRTRWWPCHAPEYTPKVQSGFEHG